MPFAFLLCKNDRCCLLWKTGSHCALLEEGLHFLKIFAIVCQGSSVPAVSVVEVVDENDLMLFIHDTSEVYLRLRKCPHNCESHPSKLLAAELEGAQRQRSVAGSRY